VPTAIILVAVAMVTFFAYRQVTESQAIERDRELTRLLAGHVTAELAEYTDLLTSIARTSNIRQGDTAIQQATLERSSNRLAVCDGGVLVLDNLGTVIAVEPERPDVLSQRSGILGQDWSDRKYLLQMVRTREPVFSDIVTDGPQGAKVIVIAIPITNGQDELVGAMLGMFHLDTTATSVFYDDLAKLRAGESGNVYLVDSNGQVIYHSDVEHIGADFSTEAVVQRVLDKEVNAVRTHNLSGQDIVAGFAPVPGTSWGLVTEENWTTLTSDSRSYQHSLILLLMLGVVAPAIVVTIGVKRITRPIGELIEAAQEVAKGHFGQTITARTGDEIEELAEQFSLMSTQLQESYAHLERRVADRTRELATLNAIAEVVGHSLNLEEILSDVLDQTLAMLEVESGGIYLIEPDGETMTLQVHQGLSEEFVEGVRRVRLGEGISGQAVARGEPVVLDVEDYPTERLAPFILKEGIQTLASTPIAHKDRALGALTLATKQPRAFPSRKLELLTAIGHQIGVGVENAWLYTSVQQELAERKRAEEGLRQAKEAAENAQRAAEAANRAKSVFLANMSHELRTPLNAILGFTQLMNRDPDVTAEQQENLMTVGQSGQHLLTLINDVLEMSKIEAGRTTLYEQSFDLHRLLDDLEDMFRLRATDKGLALVFDRVPDVPQYVRTDESKLRQVLINLLGNAVKFTAEGGVALRVACQDGQGADAMHPTLRLFFEVEDTGPGIPPDFLESVFDPFVQTANGQESREGTGLGLPISRKFVKLMGGNITVDSELGQGSVFKFDVQIALADATDIESEQPRRRVIGLEAGQPTCRLLIVEDREVNRKLLLKLLEPLGFEIREALNGQEAIKIWEEWDPHLIWMDMRMPVVDGHEATRRIKATTKGQATVIIALTASAFEEDRRVILSEGCDDFVRKPFREAEIFDRLAKHLGVRFIYEDAVEEKRDEKVAESVLTPAALATLPANWVADLYQAAIQADADLVLDLVEQIREQNGPLVGALVSLVHDFRFDTIMTLVQKMEGECEQLL
jgi:signal transduction histidine kinase/DNA-binding NarL/FixJ family response regulator